MTRRNALLALAAGAVSLAAVPALAHGNDCDCASCGRRYGRYGRNRGGSRHRNVLYGRMDSLAERIRLAERERAIDRRQADRLFERLDDVQDFLRNDRELTESEFERRMDDLDDVEEDLREYTGSRYRSYYRQHDRGYYDRYDRYDRYRSRDRDYRYRRAR